MPEPGVTVSSLVIVCLCSHDLVVMSGGEGRERKEYSQGRGVDRGNVAKSEVYDNGNPEKHSN